MKILQTAHGIYPFAHTGVPVHTYELSSELIRRGHEVLVAAPVPAAMFETIKTNVPIHPLPLLHGRSFPSDRSVNYQKQVRASFMELIRNLRPDIIHVQHLRHMGWETLKEIQATGIPFVVAVHDYWFLCRGITRMCNGSAVACARRCFTVPIQQFALNYYQTKTRKRNCTSLLNKIAAPLVSISHRTAEIFEEEGVKGDRLVVQPLGINTSLFQNVTNGRPEGPIRFGFMGSLNSEKGIHVLIRGFRRLNADATLKIYGEGDAETVENLQALAAGAPIKFYGGYDHLDVARILSSLDVLVIPSVWEETYGLVAQEALEAQKVVIVSAVGGLKDRFIHGVNGFLVPPNEPEMLALLMTDVAKNYKTIKENLDFSLGRRRLEEDGELFENLYDWTVQNWEGLRTDRTLTVEWGWQDIGKLLASYLNEDPKNVLSKLKKEWQSQGSTVADAWNSANPKTDEEITAFYKTTNAYLYDLVIAHRTSERRKWREAAVALLVKNNVQTVLDYGGGCGDDSLLFSRAGFDTTLYDLSPVNRGFASLRSEQAGTDLKVSEQPTFDRKFDAVYCTEMLEHVPEPFREIGRMSDALQPGGIMILTHSFDLVGESHPSHLEKHKELTLHFVDDVKALGFELDEVVIIPFNKFFVFRKNHPAAVS